MWDEYIINTKRLGYGKKGGFKDHHERAGTARRVKIPFQ
jgi:hypothetical protein